MKGDFIQKDIWSLYTHQQDLELNDKRKCFLHLRAGRGTVHLRLRGWLRGQGTARGGPKPEVPAVVGDALSGAVGS